MNLRLIRNATMVVEFAGKRFLIDPFFAEKESMPPFPNTPNQDRANPLVGLPIAVEDVIDVDAVIVTHLHPDHFDEAAINALPKEIKVFAQNEKDAGTIREKGFLNVEELRTTTLFEGIELIKTSGQHGRGEITQFTGEVSGVVFKHPDKQSLYIAGDSVWCAEVEAAIDTHQPEVIIVNGGAAHFLEGGPITMASEDILAAHQAAPEAKVIVVHMESLNHCMLSRDELAGILKEKKIEGNVLVPDDGEWIVV
ncbi:MBL fold metallo-hydrolase [Rossellomorea sp. y25]|uniref:MBL fold metallo-hydrolase n=1 Tax=Rossellomorea sp. y25 TaxID=3118174 RepID=UPI00260708A0|nr:MBL fold metallo-hydrolase [uncultured Rossellomorea sp.]